MREHDLRHQSRCQKVDLSPFSAVLIDEMAVQPKGTVLQRRAISSDCSCSEMQLHQFIDRHEYRAIRAKQNLTGFYLLAQRPTFFELASFDMDILVRMCARRINTGGNRGCPHP